MLKLYRLSVANPVDAAPVDEGANELHLRNRHDGTPFPLVVQAPILYFHDTVARAEGWRERIEWRTLKHCNGWGWEGGDGGVIGQGVSPTYPSAYMLLSPNAPLTGAQLTPAGSASQVTVSYTCLHSRLSCNDAIRSIARRLYCTMRRAACREEGGGY